MLKLMSQFIKHFQDEFSDGRTIATRQTRAHYMLNGILKMACKVHQFLRNGAVHYETIDMDHFETGFRYIIRTAVSEFCLYLYNTGKIDYSLNK